MRIAALAGGSLLALALALAGSGARAENPPRPSAEVRARLEAIAAELGELGVNYRIWLPEEQAPASGDEDEPAAAEPAPVSRDGWRGGAVGWTTTTWRERGE